MSKAEATSHLTVSSSDNGVEALRERHELLALATDAAQAGWATWDLQSGQSDWDEQGKQILGFADDSEAGTFEGWLNQVHPEDRPEVEAHIARCIAEDLDFNMECRIIRSDGQTRNIRATARFKTADDGTALRGTGLVIDITEQKRAEKATNESEQFVRQLLSHFPNGSVNVFDRALRYVLAEGQGLAQVGLSSEVLVGKTLDEVFSKEAVDLVKPYYLRAFAGDAVQFELPVADDVYSINATPLQYGEDGEVRTIIAVAQNITERKLVEEALRESEERFRAIVSQATAGICRADLGGRLEFVNNKMCELLGYQEAELIGRSLRELTHPDDVQENLRLFRRLAADGTPFSLEKRLLRKDGSTIWANVSVSAIRDAAGKPRSAAAVVLDVTERKRAEEALIKSEERLKRAIAIETVGVIFFRADGQIIEANDTFLQMSGYSREDLARGVLRWDVMTPPEWMPHSLVAIEELQTTGRTTPYEKEYIRKDGSRWWGLFAATQLDEEEGVEFIIDVTGRKEAEAERERLLTHELMARAQAEERRRLSRELHDRVAHDIALVHQSLELHEALKASDPERAAAKMDLARRTVTDALESTRGLSMELRQPEVRRGMESALANLLRDIVPPIVECRLLVEGDEDLVPPETRTQLFLILREAIRNAVAHSGARRIAVELDIGPTKIVGRVEDDGCGFDPQNARTSDSSGLQAMEERVALVGGTLGVSSAPGGGTQVEISVPAEAE